MAADSALLVIDAQVDMLEPPEPVADAPRLLAAVRDLIASARTAGVPVVYVQHDGGAGSPLEPGAPGWPIHPALAPRAGEPVVHKRTRDAFEGTDLADQLRRLGARNLIVAGFLSDGCVLTTCRRAASLGYGLTLVEDAHGTCDSDAEPAAAIVARVNAELAPVARLVGARAAPFVSGSGQRADA